MKIKRDVQIIAFAYECDGCGLVVAADSDKEKDRPVGYYINVRQTTGGRKFQETGDMFFHEKQCMISTLEFALSARMHYV